MSLYVYTHSGLVHRPPPSVVGILPHDVVLVEDVEQLVGEALGKVGGVAEALHLEEHLRLSGEVEKGLELALKVACAPKWFDSRVSWNQNDEALRRNSLMDKSKENLPIAFH